MTTTEDTLSRVHREVESHMGALCLALVRRRTRVVLVDVWAEALERAAADLRRLAAEMRRGR